MKTKEILPGTLAALLGLATLVAGPGAQAKEWHVATAQELQSALSNSAINGEDDTIFLAAGIYRGTFNFASGQAQSLTMQPEVGLRDGEVVLDAQGRGRVLHFVAGDSAFRIHGLVIQNGYDAFGAGMRIDTSRTVVIQNCLIQENRAALHGGGLYFIHPTSVIVSNNVIRNNYALGSGGNSGGGIAGTLVQSAIIVRNVFLSNLVNDNNNQKGGAVSLGSGGYADIRQNTFTSCQSSYAGGAVSIGSYQSNRISGNKFTGNSSGSGSAIYSSGCLVSLVSDNQMMANQGGAAVDMKSSVSNYIGNNRIVGNFCSGILVNQSQLCITRCENNVIANNDNSIGFAAVLNGGRMFFVNNTVANNSGAGARFQLSDQFPMLDCYNNVLWGNRSSGGGMDLFISGSGARRTVFNNNFHHVSGLWDFGDGNIDVDPLFVDLPNGNYHLRANSLCLNVGANSAPGLPLVDHDGNVRIGDGTVDIGAYEHSATDQHPADVNFDFNMSETEFGDYGFAWSHGLPWATGPNPIPIDYATRAGYLRQSGGAYRNVGGGKPLNFKP